MSGFGVYLSSLQTSGSLLLSYSPSFDAPEIVVNFGAINELDANGNIIGLTNVTQSHSVPSFSSTSFVFSKVTETTFENIPALTFSYNATNLVTSTTTMNVVVYFFTGSGSFTDGHLHSVDVVPGDMKFSFALSNWAFCSAANACVDNAGNTQIASFLQVQLSVINSAKSAAKTRSVVSNSSFVLGDDQLMFATTVFVDNTLTDLAADPVVSTDAGTGSNVFTLRFPVFTSSLVYDPFVSIPRTPDVQRSLSEAGIYAGLITLILVVGILPSAFTRKAIQDWYPTLRLPSWTPPNWLFGPVWTVLYIMMGASIARFYIDSYTYHDSQSLSAGIAMFSLQYLLNIMFTVVFFGFKKIGWSAVLIIVNLLFVIITIAVFNPVSPVAGGLMIPYILWLAYAASVSVGTYYMNMEHDSSAAAASSDVARGYDNFGSENIHLSEKNGQNSGNYHY